jgi:predicted Zn-dependent peptidase
MRAIVAGSVALGVARAASASAQVSDWPLEVAPRALAARPSNFPPYEVRTLPNGMQVIVVLHHEQPAVSMRLLVRAGAAYVAPGNYGLTMLLASLLDQGTTTRSARQIADTIDSIGGSLNTGAATDLTFVGVLVMKDSFQLGMDLIANGSRRCRGCGSITRTRATSPAPCSIG